MARTRQEINTEIAEVQEELDDMKSTDPGNVAGIEELEVILKNLNEEKASDD